MTAQEVQGRRRRKFKLAYTIVERQNKRFWVKVGVAFENEDGNWNIRLDAIPVNGQLQLRERHPFDEPRRDMSRDDVPPHPRSWRAERAASWALGQAFAEVRLRQLNQPT